MIPEDRFLNGVEIPEKILCDCRNQKKLLEFFAETRYRAYENDICPTTYFISEPDPVFDPDRIYGYELLTHIFKYKNITTCNEVKYTWVRYCYQLKLFKHPCFLPIKIFIFIRNVC